MKLNKTFVEWIAVVNLIVGLLIAIMGLLIGKDIGPLNFLKENLTKANFLIITEVVNLLVLVLGCIFLKSEKLEFSDSQIPIFAEQLKVIDHNFRTANANIERVNTIVNSIVANTNYFIFSLIVFYIFNMLASLGTLKSIENHDLQFPFTEFIINASNMISGSFIFLNFIILYRNTFDRNKTGRNYYSGTLLFTFFYLFVYFIALLFTRSGSPQLTENINMTFKLVCGLYNGFAMGLLFGRFTSMEFYLKEINVNKNWLSKLIYNYGIVYVLSFYGLAQTMFGVMDMPQMPYLVDFKSVIFLVSFVGKSFFLILLYQYINSRYLHVYLHLLLANCKMAVRFAEVFPQIGYEVTAPADPAEEKKGNPINPSKILLEGEYTYECIQKHSTHRHGGECRIEFTQQTDDIKEWRLVGQRLWQREGEIEAIYYDDPPYWNSEKAIIFKDKSYIYTFYITVGDVNYVGFSKGDVILCPDQKTVLAFRGHYFMHKGTEISWGKEIITRIS